MPMSPTVAILDTGYESYHQEEALLTAAGYALGVFSGDRHDIETKIAFAQGAEGILLRWTTVDDAFLDRLPQVRALVRYGVGYDNVDINACSRHSVRVANVQGYADHSVSTHALALILACARNLKQGMTHVCSEFGAPPRSANLDLHERVLGIVGLGHIGGTLAVKASSLFGEILGADPYISDDRFRTLGVRRVPLDTVLRESHVISLHCNLTDKTRNLVDKQAFDTLQKTPILVNTARGEIVDPSALLTALETGRIHSAGVDVFSEEPPGPDWDALLAHPHLIATGHYAWHSVRAAQELQRRAAENMRALLQGERTEDCLNP